MYFKLKSKKGLFCFFIYTLYIRYTVFDKFINSFSKSSFFNTFFSFLYLLRLHHHFRLLLFEFYFLPLFGLHLCFLYFFLMLFFFLLFLLHRLLLFDFLIRLYYLLFHLRLLLRRLIFLLH